MFKLNDKLQVKADHKFHPGKIGYFQFLGEGKSEGVIVLSDRPTDVRKTGVYFAVLVNDVTKL